MSRSLSPGKGTPCDFHPYQSHSWIQLHEVVVDKEYQLECARDELQKLAVLEQEERRKDEVISALRKEIAEYKKCTQSGDMRYASMEEKLSSCDSHLRDKIKEVQMLQLELESVREQLKAATSRSTAIRKERSRQSQWEEEVRDMRKQQRSDEESIATLKGELAEKKKNIQSMQERLKKFRSENQDLKSRLESVQAIQDSKTSRERELKAEIDHLKSQASNTHILQAKYNFSEQELSKAKDKENTMAAQLGRIESELSEVCGHVLSSFQVSKSGRGHEASPRAAFQVVTQFAEAHFKMEESLAKCEQDLEEHKEDLTNLNCDIVHMCKCWKAFQEGVKVDVTSAVTTLVESLQRPGNSDGGHAKELLDVMRESVGALHTSEDQAKRNLAHLENHIKSCYESLQEHKQHTHTSGEEDAARMVTSMKSLLQSSLSQVAKLKERLIGAELEHSASLSGAVTALRQDEEKRMSVAMDRIKSEEEERLTKELANLKELHAFEKEEAILQEQEIAATLSKELEALKLVVESERQEREAEKSKLLEMETKLLAAEHSKSEALSETRSYKEKLQHQFSEQVSEFKEQAQQYALTIVAMEEKLLKLMETCKTLQADNQGLTKQLESVTSSNSLEIKNRSEKISKMEELIQVLRNQLGLTSDDAGQKEAAIKLLEDESAKFKQEMEDHKALIQQKHEEEIADLQLTMAKQEAVIACQKEELENLNESLSKKTTELADKSHENSRVREEMAALQKSFESSQNVIVQQSHRVLLEAGHVCLGDNHCQTIENQRTAIAQLRERLNELELAKPPVASHQATLKELSRVRHELMRVKSELSPGVKRSVVQSATLKLPSVEARMSDEGATHQLQDTLECSERTYHNLVEAICKGVPDCTRCPVEDEDHLLATDEQARKKQVLKERKKFADNVCRKLALQAKQQAKLQASIKSAEGGGRDEEESVEEKSPQQVIADLEAVLSATAEQLEQQKRLNQSLLKRKSFKESQFNASKQRPRHKCVTYS